MNRDSWIDRNIHHVLNALVGMLIGGSIGSSIGYRFLGFHRLFLGDIVLGGALIGGVLAFVWGESIIESFLKCLRLFLGS